MSEFKPGQIVYVSDDKVTWRVAHYIETTDEGIIRTSTNRLLATMGTKCNTPWRYCLAVEDYNKMLNTPKHKDLCECWDNSDTHHRQIAFYDLSTNSAFEYDGNGKGYTFGNYKPIPRDQWPEWAIEAYKTLRD